ncbi:peptide deformylase [Sphingorhabdus soli]|uniref:Peptide deformylase n=1 Tax=Flavisphingopyxis soli TaxID=2601267 RepID=A0A5C6U7Z8_9SPHN|nr:peptide deformylase [Sphingorhabdus soli]TXC68919.1 peptide deformylase [Sphingorhabdus soli]
MAIREIIEVPDARLRTISKPVEVFDADLKTLTDDMLETMYDAIGIGLAAIQVGVPQRILVIDLQEPDPEDEEGKRVIRDPQIFINPVFSEQSEEHTLYNEGCLSVPEQYAEVSRPAEVTVDWHDLDGTPHKERMTGFMATVIQHEMDHLEGILFIDHLSRLKRDMVLKKLTKLRKAA